MNRIKTCLTTTSVTVLCFWPVSLVLLNKPYPYTYPDKEWLLALFICGALSQRALLRYITDRLVRRSPLFGSVQVARIAGILCMVATGLAIASCIVLSHCLFPAHVQYQSPWPVFEMWALVGLCWGLADEGTDALGVFE